MFETHLTITGNVITNVVRRRLLDGTTLVTFRVASNERRYDKDTGAWANGDSLYVSVTCWRQLGENVLRTFSVGDPVIVRGRLYTRSYEDKEGRRQSVMELEGLAVGPDLSRSVASITRLHRDGTPYGVVASGSDEEGTRPHADAIGSADGAKSDDPWRVAEEAEEDDFADRADHAGANALAAEAAVGA